MERCPSGLRSSIGNAVCFKRHPGFESLSLREEEEWLSGLKHTLAKRAWGKIHRRFESFFLRRGVAQSGRASRLGREGHRFESGFLDKSVEHWGIVQWQDPRL